jgi:hypothetical protein
MTTIITTQQPKENTIPLSNEKPAPLDRTEPKKDMSGIEVVYDPKLMGNENTNGVLMGLNISAYGKGHVLTRRIAIGGGAGVSYGIGQLTFDSDVKARLQQAVVDGFFLFNINSVNEDVAVELRTGLGVALGFDKASQIRFDSPVGFSFRPNIKVAVDYRIKECRQGDLFVTVGGQFFGDIPENDNVTPMVGGGLFVGIKYTQEN